MACAVWGLVRSAQTESPERILLTDLDTPPYALTDALSGVLGAMATAGEWQSALRGGSAKLDPVFPSVPLAPGTTIGAATLATGIMPPAVSTPWVSAPGAFTGHCSGAGGAHVLRVTPQDGAPTPTAVPDATWGLHLLDANIALGDLVDVVGTQANRWVARHPG